MRFEEFLLIVNTVSGVHVVALDENSPVAEEELRVRSEVSSSCSDVLPVFWVCNTKLSETAPTATLRAAVVKPIWVIFTTEAITGLATKPRTVNSVKTKKTR